MTWQSPPPHYTTTYIHLSWDCCADLLWWESFTPQWIGQCFLTLAILMQPSITVTLDTSGMRGCGGIHQEQRFQFTWSRDWHPVHITAKELVPIVLAAILWGNKWQGQAVIFQCDNQAVIHCIKAHTSKNPVAMKLLRCLFMLAATHDFYPLATHIAGIDNGPAEALSRDMLSTFHHQVPLANPQATEIPHKVTALFQQPAMDWTSPSWRRVSWIPGGGFSGIHAQGLQGRTEALLQILPASQNASTPRFRATAHDVCYILRTKPLSLANN